MTPVQRKVHEHYLREAESAADELDAQILSLIRSRDWYRREAARRRDAIAADVALPSHYGHGASL